MSSRPGMVVTALVCFLSEEAERRNILTPIETMSAMMYSKYAYDLRSTKRPIIITGIIFDVFTTTWQYKWLWKWKLIKKKPLFKKGRKTRYKSFKRNRKEREAAVDQLLQHNHRPGKLGKWGFLKTIQIQRSGTVSSIYATGTQTCLITFCLS